MNIRLLGTGAADGIPGLYADNRVSCHARTHGGMDVRTRSAALVDGLIKIDFPPDTLCQLQRERINARDWTAIVFTHSHEDHFAVSEIQYALYPFTELDQLPAQIYGNRSVGKLLAVRYPDWPLDFIEMRSFCSYRHSSYLITPVLARHGVDEQCLNLMLQREGKTILYATDTGIWAEPTFAFVCEHALDCLVIECTAGLQHSDYEGHLDIYKLASVLERLRNAGAVHDRTRVVTTHHAHTGDATHHELIEALAPLGAEPGFDGMHIEF